MRLPIALLSCAAVVTTLAFPAVAATLVAGAGPNSDSATQACVPPQGSVSGSSTVTFSTTCSRADVGTASGDAVAATGHVGTSAHADSHNGNSLVAEIAAQGIYDDFLVFTSSNPANTVASVSANLILTGILEASGPVAIAGVESAATIAGSLFGLRFTMDQAGNLDGFNNFFVDSGTVGLITNLQIHTPFVSVALNSPIHFRLDLQTGAVASGPGSHALSDFLSTSFKLPTGTDAFNLPEGVTVNAGDYLVNNRFIDPLAPAVPEPQTWALLLAGFGVIGTSLRRRRALALR